MLRARTLTLLFTLSLILAIAFTVVDAHIDTPPVRRHAPATHRMIRKRAPPTGSGSDNTAGADTNDPLAGNNPAVANPAAAPADTDTKVPADKATDTATNIVTKTDPAAARPNTPTNTPTVTPPANTNTAKTTEGGLLDTLLSPLLGGPSTTSTTSSTPTSTSTSTSTSTTSTSSTTSSSTTPTSSATAENDSVVPTRTTSTITNSASPSSTEAPSTSSGSVTKLQRNTIIILVAIGASIGAAGLIWTIIRKWKFRPSSSFEDRMQPIDWQPTTSNDRDITEKLGRSNSTRSHGSFTSGNNHGNDHLAADLPSHDFTAGPAHLAPVGGYADLQRGPSPQPDLHRGPSYRSPSPYQYDIPNPQHGGYYNGGYQGGYDHNRGY